MMLSVTVLPSLSLELREELPLNGFRSLLLQPYLKFLLLLTDPRGTEIVLDTLLKA